MSVAVEAALVLAGSSTSCGPVQALQYWVTLFGIQDFVVRISGCVQDGSGRTKLLALVEDSLTLIEGDIETNGRLVFWWPPGNRRVLFQTSGQWAWEYRKQCVYCGGYLYIDAETGEELFGSDLSFEKYFFVETEEEGLWNILFLRGVRGGLRTELGRFQTPVVYEYPLVEHTDAVHEHTDAVHDAAVEASSCQRMNYTSAAETQTEGLLRCAEAIELDTDVVAGKGLVVIRLTQQPAQRNENEKETKTQQAAQSASAPRTNQMWTIFAMPHGHAEGAMQIAALSLQPPPPPHLEALPLQTAQRALPLSIAHALLSQDDLTWASGTLTLIDAEAGLGSRNHKQVEATLAAPPTQPHLFSGNDMFPCLGVLSLRMRSSNVEQRIVGGVLARLENECLQVRAAAVHTLKVYVGIGNTEAILGVLARLRHPQLSVRAAAADALPFVAHRGDQLAVQGCLGCMLSEAWWVRASALEAFRTICGSRDAEAMQLIEAFETEVCPDRSRTEQPTDMARVKELVAGLQRVEAAARKEKK